MRFIQARPSHGYELMGVGASYIGFISAEPPDTSLSNVVAKDFCALYNTSDEDLQTRISAVARRFPVGRIYGFVTWNELRSQQNPAEWIPEPVGGLGLLAAL